MNKLFTLGILASSLAITACNNQPDKASPSPQPSQAPNQAPAAAATPKKGPITEAEVKAFAQTFEQAMQAVPPELREDFHKYWECEVAANKARPAAQQKTMDAARVTEMTAALKANRSLAACSG